MRKYLGIMAIALFGVATLVGSAPPKGESEDVPIIDGEVWKKSSMIEKRSYIIGASNLMVIEYTYQIEGDVVPTDDQTLIQRFFKGSDDTTVDEAIGQIDRWYKNNPSELSRPVLAVVWQDMILPKLAAMK